MKKLIIFLFTIMSLNLLNPNITLGFLDDSLGFDLYKTIDKWTYELSSQMLSREAKWDEKNSDYVKKLNIQAWFLDLPECFDESITLNDLKELNENNPLNFNKKIIDLCWNWDDESKKNMEIKYLNLYQDIWKTVYSNLEEISQTKVDNLYKITKIWMYSDWDTNNSPFDIIADLKAIDDIVFEKELKYNWENTIDLTSKITKASESEVSTASLAPYIPWNIKNLTSLEDLLTYDLNWLDNNNLVCDVDDPLKNQIKDIIKTKNENLKDLIEKNNNTNSWVIISNPDKWYEVRWDNWVWPCNNFFCIQIEFVIQNYDLLIWWKNNSIEWLIKKSNQHLKKFSSTSLIQSKMTTNNFELWLKDLNLSEIFHVWIQVTTKPAPILNVDVKWDDPKKDEFSSKSLLEKYYGNLWLDYKRANDLSVYTWYTEKLKNIQMMAWIPAEWIIQKNKDFLEYKEKNEKKAAYTASNYIDQSLNYNELDTFYKDFVEVENFTYSISDYVDNLNSIIKWMNKIPNSWN